MPEPSDYVITIEGGGWSARVTLTEEEFERLLERFRAKTGDENGT